MYTEYYRLSGRPFQLTPDPRFYFDSQTHRKAMAYLGYGIAQGEGFIIITGDIGAGKTTLVGHLMDTIDRTSLTAARVVTTQVGGDDMLRLVAQSFGLQADGLDKAGLLARVERFLHAQHAEGRRVLLIVDEAQNLPLSALEELRMLSNFQIGERALLQTFLLGQPEFRETLAGSPDLEQLRQRVIATHHLSPMQADEVPAYIMHRLRQVGWRGDPAFTDGAYRLLYDYSQGVPRKLNTLAARVLLFGAIEERHEIDEDTVREVVGDLVADGMSLPSRPPAAAVAAGDGGDNGELAARVALLERYAGVHGEALQVLIAMVSDLARTEHARAPGKAAARHDDAA